MATAPKAVQKAPAKAAPAEEAAPEPKKKSKKMLVIFIVLFLLLAGGGAAAFFLLGSDEAEGDGKASKAKPKEIKPPVFLVLEPFTVNLQPETAGEQYLQVAFSMQVADAKDVDTIKLYMPQVRSRVLLLLSGKKASEINTVEGKKKLADEIVAQVKQPFAPGGPPTDVTAVFFTSFVIQ